MAQEISSKTKYDIEQASNQSLKPSARKNYAENAEAGAKDDNAKMYPKKDKGPKWHLRGHREKEKGPKTFEGGAHRGEMKHAKDGSEEHLGPKMYGAHKDKGSKMYGKDHGPKMTSDPQSYRSSISQHWHKENLLSENPIARRAAGK